MMRRSRQIVGAVALTGLLVACATEGDSDLVASLSSGTTAEEGQAVIEILESDVAFSSDGCDRWTDYEPPATPVTEFGSGDRVVGEQIAPGTYQAEGESCYWERASGFTHGFGEIIANDVPAGRAVVEITPGDVRFTSNGCGTWAPL